MEDRPEKLECPECGAILVLKQSRFGQFWGCTRWKETGCKGGIGAHPDGRPLGIPANKETKAARIEAHRLFDMLWKDNARQAQANDNGAPVMLRKDAYVWMQDAMGMTKDQAHIGNFDKATCDKLISKVKEFLGIS